MATINPHTTRATGTVLTATIYNTDHQNHITNANNLNAQLASLSGVSAITGIIAGNGAGVFSGRSIQGTANQIGVANANGVTADPTLSLSSTMVLPGTLAISGGLVESLSGVILVPTNQTYLVGIKMPFSGVINETVTRCSGGTCLARWNIDGVAVGVANNAVSTVESAVAHGSANAFAKDQDIQLAISSNASCLNLGWTLKFTRTTALNGV
jgi:hypothetical protein